MHFYYGTLAFENGLAGEFKLGFLPIFKSTRTTPEKTSV